LGVAFFIGVLLGNILQGFPIGPNGAMTMSIFGLINSFTLMFGILSVLLCVLHGSIFLRMKAFGSLEKRMENNFTLIWGGYFIFVLPVGVSSWQSVPNWSARILNLDYYLVLAGLFILSLILTWVYRYKMHISFTFSSLSIIFGALMLGSTHFPKIVPSSINPKYGLDIYNTASEPQTHLLMLFVALIGVPLVLVYTAIVYRVFRGKLNMQDGGYD